MNNITINNNNNQNQNLYLDVRIKSILENKLTGDQNKELDKILKIENKEEKENKLIKFIKDLGPTAAKILASILLV